MTITSGAPKETSWLRGRTVARAAIFVGGIGAAAVSLALVRDDSRPDPALALPVERPLDIPQDAPSVAAASRAGRPLLLARARIETEPAADLFTVPAPPAPPASQRPMARPRPTVPPFAFRYVGRIEQDGVTKLFLARGDDLIIVAKGEAIGDGFRLDDVGPNTLTVTYLPLRKAVGIGLDTLAGTPQTAADVPQGGAPVEDADGVNRTTPGTAASGVIVPPPAPAPRARVRPAVPGTPDAPTPEPMSHVTPLSE